MEENGPPRDSDAVMTRMQRADFYRFLVAQRQQAFLSDVEAWWSQQARLMSSIAKPGGALAGQR